MDYDVKDTQYYIADRYDIVDILPSNINTVLDIGCSQGDFAATVKKKFDCEAWGIEPMKDQADIAKTKLDKVLHGHIEEHLNALPDNYFDVITFNDVLEHLVDPYEILSMLQPKLSANGHIAASIPNVRYIRNIYKMLVAKDWEYEDGGILDRTHLRFFTKKSMIRMFEDTGYTVENIKGITQMQKAKSLIVDVCSLGSMHDTTYKQFAILAKPN